jgi:hypothetical protein
MHDALDTSIFSRRRTNEVRRARSLRADVLEGNPLSRLIRTGTLGFDSINACESLVAAQRLPPPDGRIDHAQ